MNTQIILLNQSRKFILEKINHLSIEQLNKIPKGFSNNIVWNVAHLVVTQQILCYKFSNSEMLVSNELVNAYKKGTKPEKFVTETEWESIKNQFVQLPKKFKKDLENHLFHSYTEYETSLGVTLKNINDATIYNTHHEGIHFGTILQLIKLV